MVRYLYELGKWHRPPHVGGKALGLHWLLRHKMDTTRAWACTWDAHRASQQGRPNVLADLCAELDRVLEPGRSYAVRSSANVEDHSAHSFAGQFRSVLDVRGSEAIAEAIASVWDSAKAPGAVAYSDAVRQRTDGIEMGIVIQEMVTPVYSGLSFSKHPTTGMDETLVEGIRGSGEALVQTGVTPERWRNKWGAWLETPQEPVLPIAVVDEVVARTRQIARAYGKPVDLEWVYDGERVRWLQVRAITGIDRIDVYSNRISGEFLPGIILPLVWSINVPIVNSAWIALLTELVGPNDLTPERLARSFYYRAYFNMQPFGEIFARVGLPRESLELMMGLDPGGDEKPSFRPGWRALRLLPRLVGFALAKIGFSRRTPRILQQARVGFGTYAPNGLETLSDAHLIERIDALRAHTQHVAYLNIVIPLLMQFFHMLLRVALDRAGIDYEHLDLMADMPEMDALNPNTYLAALKRTFDTLTPDIRERVLGRSNAALTDIPEALPLREGLDAFMERFGHFSDSGNDLSRMTWRETPKLVLRMVSEFSLRQSASQALPWARLPLSGLQRALFTPIYARARRYRWLRERVSSLYTFGYGLLRPHLLALGDRLVRRGLIRRRDDVLYLEYDTLSRACADGTGMEAMGDLVERRKREVDRVRDIAPPTIIYGQDEPPLDHQASSTLAGTPTSRGRHTGPARIVRGLADWDKVREGDVLIVPYSDVGWTPLFAKAGAVVAESGGILSHSSIVAREMGIPAVVSVPGATGLAEGTLITVDGFKGEIAIRAEAHDELALAAGGRSA